MRRQSTVKSQKEEINTGNFERTAKNGFCLGKQMLTCQQSKPSIGK